MAIKDIFRGLVRGSVLGKCDRKYAFIAFDIEQQQSRAKAQALEIDETENPRFVDGHYHEWDVKRRMLNEGVNFSSGISLELETRFTVIPSEWTVEGHVDGIIHILRNTPRWLPDNGSWLLEIKSMNSGSFFQFIKKGLEESFPDYYGQIQGYLGAVPLALHKPKYENGYLLDMYEWIKNHHYSQSDASMVGRVPQKPARALAIAKNKESGELHSEAILYDDQYVEKMRRRWIEASDAVEQYTLPPRLHSSMKDMECRFCPFQQDCWQDEAGAESKIIDINSLEPRIRNAIHTFVDTKKIERNVADILGDARTFILDVVGEDLGKTQIGPLTVNTYTKTVESIPAGILKSRYPEVYDELVKRDSLSVSVITTKEEKDDNSNS